MMISRWVGYALLVAATPVLHACGDDPTTSPDVICDGVTCSGHGRCAVLDDTIAVCVCDEGYVAVGVTCLVDSGPCAGISCSDHGECSVRGSDTPWCECDAGYASHDAAGDGSPLYCVAGASFCLRGADCDSGQVCTLETGACEVLASESCGPPATSSGTVAAGSLCSATSPCASGLTCVPKRWALPLGEIAYVTADGVCLPACDPCAPACGEAETCFHLTGGGGFCAESLSGVGESPAHDGVCAGPAPNGACVEQCIPSAGGLSHFPGFTFPADSSPQCGSTEACVLWSEDLDGTQWGCLIAEIHPPGDRCTLDRSHVCRQPAHCMIIAVGMTLFEDGLCVIPGDTCDAEHPCADGYGCLKVPCSSPSDYCEPGVCIRDGSGKLGQLCTEDRNCEGWLTCADLTCQAAP